MARLPFALLLATRAAAAEPEHYETIRVDGGMTASAASISDRSGVGFVTEVKAMANDHLALGGRVEVAVMFGGHLGDDNVPLDVTMSACGLLKAEYLFGLSTVRPFVAMGAGVYSIGSHSIDAGPTTAGIHTTVGDYLGIAPEVGVDVGRVRAALTYNAIFGAGLDVHETNGNMETRTLSQNYLSLEVSFRFGGGPRR